VGRQGWLDFLRLGVVPPAGVLNAPFQHQAGPHSLGKVGELFLGEPEYFLNATGSVGT
jgi:hypothetical protein